MRLLIQAIFLISLALTPLHSGFANETVAQTTQPVFAHRVVDGDATRYEQYLKKNWSAKSTNIAELLKVGQQSLATDPRLASRQFATAVVSDPKNSAAWLSLSQALLAIKPDPNKGGERYDLPVNASASAYRAYQLSSNRNEKAVALRILAAALERRSYWRPAIDALKISLSLVKSAQTEQAYNRLRKTHGFRMIDYKADTEATPPRLCLQFSETLASNATDFAKFVRVNGKDPQNVRAEGRQLCIDGLGHGQRYQIQARAGLPAKIDEQLLKTAEISVYLPDRKPSVRFTGRNYVLPSRGQQGIPVVSVNTENVSVEVYRIGDRNLAQTLENGDLQRQLSTWDIRTLKQKSGEKVYTGTLAVQRKLNKDITTAFPVTDAIGTLKPGVYAMVAQVKDLKTSNGSGPATQWFIVSDLSITAFSGDDGIHTFIRSLETTAPIANAKVRLVARNNEVLGEALADKTGYVKFSSGLAKGEDGLQPAMLIAEHKPGGYAFLDLTSSAFDLSDRGVQGRAAPGPVDAFLYTDRGVYRPGEDVHLTTLIRNAQADALGLPVTMIVSRPDGVEHQRLILKDDGLGGRSTSLSLTNSAMTGTWRARIHTDPKAPALTDVSFLVEDFVPERLDLELKTDAEVIKIRENLLISAAGRFLYGAPAAGLAIEGDVVVRPSYNGLKNYPGYQFGLANERVTPVRDTVPGLPSTGTDGKAKLSVKLPAIPKTAKPLEADILVRLRESGGRTIERRVTLPVATQQERIGVKPIFKSNTVADGDQAEFDIVHLGASGAQSAGQKLKWVLYRVETNWQWYSQNGSWSYEAVSITRKVSNGELSAPANGAERLRVPVDYGRYQLEVTTADKAPVATTVAFQAGWYVSGENADSPELLDVALDKNAYKIGETAKVRIASKSGGTALISVLGDRLWQTKEVEIGAGQQEVDIKVDQDWGAGAYVTTVLYRPMDKVAKRMPSRAVGITWLKLDTSPRTLDVAIDLPAKQKASKTLRVPVKISGLEPGEDARLTIAAVDLGIVNLTRFKTPAPDKWFYSQHKLAHEIRDFYGRLIDGMRAQRGALRSGGDGGIGLQMQGTPPPEDTVALFSGIVEVGEDGTAEVEFPVPNFNGTVRVMTVAWSKSKLGHGVKDIVIRDPVALTASAPRTLNFGDEAEMTLDLHNVEGVGDAYKLVINAQAESQSLSTLVDKQVSLKTGERKTQRITLKPTRLGRHTYAMRLTGAPNIDVVRSISIDVQPPANDIKRTTVSKLQPGETLRLTSDVATDLIAGRTRVQLSVGRHARLDVPSLMTQLDRYPYGCAEQTVSKTLPLLYLSALTKKVAPVSEEDVKKRVRGAIQHVFSMQDSSGAFGAWGPSYTNIWLTSYVTDFLTRAVEQGYDVPKRNLNQSLDRLANYIAYAQDFEKGGEERAYALYVLARNSRAPIGELRYYADTRLGRFSTPLAKAHLGAALAMMGDNDRATRAFNAAIASLKGSNAAEPVYSRQDYGSQLRDGAALVALTTETGINAAQAPELVDVISEAASSRTYTSTQEQAWMLLAANALSSNHATTQLSLNGKSLGSSIFEAMSATELATQGTVAVKNDGETPVDAVVSVIGAALTPEPAISKGFEISRRYFTLKGEEVDLTKSAKVSQNQRLVAVLSVKAERKKGRLLLVDRLPTGFEIENPRLIDSGNVKTLTWLKTITQPEHTDFRDDRFMAAYDLSRRKASFGPNGETLQVAYIVRAVTPGKFVHPAATIEDMYAPDRYARTSAGRITITSSR